MAGRRVTLVGLALAVAGCDFTGTQVAPSTVPHGDFQSNVAPHGDFEWDVAPPEMVDRPFIVGCANVVVTECDAIVGSILAATPGERTSPTVVEIELFCTEASGDEAPASCPHSLSARAGMATIEFGDGLQPLQFTVSGSADSPTVESVALGACPPFCWELSTPVSPKVTGTGPFEFQVGHCGLNHFNDFDGSFWVVAGFVSGDAANSGVFGGGRMHVIDADTVFYRHEPSDGGEAFFARLERLPGPKFIWQWCA